MGSSRLDCESRCRAAADGCEAAYLEGRRGNPGGTGESPFTLMSAAAVGRIAAGWLEAGRNDVDAVLTLAEHSFRRVAALDPAGSRPLGEAVEAARVAAEACSEVLRESARSAAAGRARPS